MGALVSWSVRLIQLRDGVNAALEAARNEKKIGKSLEAHITLVRAQDQADNLTALAGEVPGPVGRPVHRLRRGGVGRARLCTPRGATPPSPVCGYW